LENNIEVYTEDGAAKQSKIKELIKKVIEFLKSIPQRLRKLIDAIKKKISKVAEFVNTSAVKLLQKKGKFNRLYGYSGDNYTTIIIYTGYGYFMQKDILGYRLSKIHDSTRLVLNTKSEEDIISDLNDDLGKIFKVIGGTTGNSIKKYLVGDEDYSKKEQKFYLDNEIDVVDDYRQLLSVVNEYINSTESYFDDVCRWLHDNGGIVTEKVLRYLNQIAYILELVGVMTLDLISKRYTTASEVIQYFTKHAKKEEREKYDL
jgi:protein involved in ribonucleotide reduction